MIYFETEKEYTIHIWKVLQKLQKYTLFVKLFKCVFGAEKIEFFRFLVSMNSISIDLAQVNSVFLWLVLGLFWDIQVF